MNSKKRLSSAFIAMLTVIFFGSAIGVFFLTSALREDGARGGQQIGSDGTMTTAVLPAAVVGQADTRLASLLEKVGSLPRGNQDLPHVATTVVQHDEDWDQLPRERAMLARSIMSSMGNLDPRIVYRHFDMNPRDVYIHPDMRALIASIVMQYVESFKEIRASREHVLLNELQSLIDNGLVPRREIPHSSESASEDPRLREMRVMKARELGIPEAKILAWSPTTFFSGHIPFTYKVDEHAVYSAELAQLPVTTRYVQAEEFVAMEMASFLRTAFDGIDPESSRIRDGFLQSCFLLVQTHK